MTLSIRSFASLAFVDCRPLSSGQAQHLNRELSVIVDQLQAAATAGETAAGRLTELEKL
jgi:hypothetical protein